MGGGFGARRGQVCAGAEGSICFSGIRGLALLLFPGETSLYKAESRQVLFAF